LILPDALAAEAQAAGLLSPQELERLLREELRERRIAALAEARVRLASNPPPLTAGEIQNEIEAYREASRRASDS